MSKSIVILSGSPRKNGNTDRLAIDRTYALLRAEMPAKKSALLITCGADSASAADGAVATYKGMCSHSGREDAGIIIASGLHAPDEIEGRPELEQARALGREI